MQALVAIIGLALVFDYINGFHDAANSIATVVSTRVLSPRVAVVWAAFFNFIAFLFFESKVAGNIAKGIHPSVVSLTLVLAGLTGAIIWDLLTWWWALPTSSSHALLGGLAGAAIAKAGIGSLGASLCQDGHLHYCFPRHWFCFGIPVDERRNVGFGPSFPGQYRPPFSPLAASFGSSVFNWTWRQ